MSKDLAGWLCLLVLAAYPSSSILCLGADGRSALVPGFDGRCLDCDDGLAAPARPMSAGPGLREASCLACFDVAALGMDRVTGRKLDPMHFVALALSPAHAGMLPGVRSGAASARTGRRVDGASPLLRSAVLRC